MFLNAVDGTDIRMVESGRGFRLLNEAASAIRVDGVAGQQLQGYVPVQMRIECLIDNAHSAFADLRNNPIVVKVLAYHGQVLNCWPPMNADERR